MNELNDLLCVGSDTEEHKTIVRITSSSWNDSNGIYIKRCMRYLRRKSKGCNVVEEEVLNIGAEEVLPRIINFNECDDGVYELVTCNERRDYETGYIDDYDYKLIQVKDA